MLSLFIFLLISICCSAFFSGSETTLFSLSKVDIHRFSESKYRSARKIIYYLRRPRDTLVTILLGNEFFNVCISILGVSILNQMNSTLTVEMKTALSVLCITPFLMLFGEILPKNISILYATQLAQIIIWPLILFNKITYPLQRVLTWVADKIIHAISNTSEPHIQPVMEDEYRKLVDLGGKAGVIEEEERELIHNVFEFSEKRVSDIMTDISHVFMLSVDVEYDQFLGELKSTQYSRVPCYEGDSNNIIGIFLVKNLFALYRKKSQGNQFNLKNHIHPVINAVPQMPVEKLLREFQRLHMHMAIVKDHDNTLLGLITMDDILEELFGELER